jgi:hypothetical protein
LKSDNGYRFNLSFKGETSEQRVVGDFLNKLKSKKSRFIVNLIADYLQAHPELLQEKESHEITIRTTLDYDILEKMKKDMRSYLDEAVTEAISQLPIQASNELPNKNHTEDLNDMLQDMDIF